MAVRVSDVRSALDTELRQCPPPSECPDCGKLECFCRPRFFAGQLLTDEDLNRLERYVIEKNKLHNRYLHGWGVVCGLEVVCHPCPNLVTVRTGYALSPCGEDIVVCRDETVDICALIQKCRPPDRPPECDPLRSHAPEDCREVTENWILAICYDEKPSRGITALRGASGTACCSRCNCGGSSACGCSCHNGGKKNGNGCQSKQRNPLPQCEPTVVCEGYSFIAYKAPPKDPVGRTSQPQGEWPRRFLECWSTLTSILSAIPQGANNGQLHTWFLEFKAALFDFLSQYPTYDCSYYDRLNQITVAPPTPDPSWTSTFFVPGVNRMTALAAEYWLHCFCATLLPPCPEPVQCNCVPLATIKIRKADCRILEVCNWGPRRLVLTFPHLEYWLSPWGSQEALRAAIEKMCCAPSFLEKSIQFPREGVGVAAPPVTQIPMSTISENTFASLFSQSWLNKTRTIDAQTLMLAALGFVGDDNRALANQFEFDNALSFLLLNQVVRPTFEATLPTELSGLLELLAKQKTGRGTTESAAAGEVSEIVALRQMVTELQKTMQEQGEQIRILKETHR